MVTEAVPEQAAFSEKHSPLLRRDLCGRLIVQTSVRDGMLQMLACLDRAFVSGDAGAYLGEVCTTRYMESLLRLYSFAFRSRSP